MSAVDGVRTSAGVAPAAGVPGVGRPTAGFAMPAAGRAGGAANGATAVSAPMALDSMLALQELGADAEGDGAGKRYVVGLLAELTALQRALLLDGDPETVLQRLNAMLEAAPYVAAPQLAAILGAVRLRARVELARRGFTRN